MGDGPGSQGFKIIPWPLLGSPRRYPLRGLTGGTYSVLRGKSPVRAEQRLETVSDAAETRLTAELAALQGERQRIVTETATDKAARTAKKSSRWW